MRPSLPPRSRWVLNQSATTTPSPALGGARPTRTSSCGRAPLARADWGEVDRDSDRDSEWDTASEGDETPRASPLLVWRSDRVCTHDSPLRSRPRRTTATRMFEARRHEKRESSAMPGLKLSTRRGTTPRRGGGSGYSTSHLSSRPVAMGDLADIRWWASSFNDSMAHSRAPMCPQCHECFFHKKPGAISDRRPSICPLVRP